MYTLYRRYLYTITALIGLFLPCFAQAASTTEDFGILPSVSMVTASPSGDLIAMRKTQGDKDLFQVYSFIEKKFIAGYLLEDIVPNNVYFLNETSLVVIGSENRKVAGFKGDIDVSTAFLLNIEDGKIKQLLTPGDVIYPGQSGLGDIVGVSKDGRYVYMPAYVEKERGGIFYSVVKVDTKSPRQPRVFDKGHRHAKNFFMNDSGDIIARELFNEKDGIHTLEAKQDGRWVSVYRKKVGLRQISFVGVSADFKSLVVLYIPRDKDRSEYGLMSLEDGTITPQNYEREDADIERVYQDLNQVVYGISYSGFYPSYRFFNSTMQSKADSVLAMFQEESVFLTPTNVNKAHFVAHTSGSLSAGSFYLFTDTPKPRFIASAYHSIQNEDVDFIGISEIKARDGLTIPLLLTIPQERVANMKNMPAVIMPHGGPEAYDQIGFDWMAQALSNKGYLVVQPQFRGSTGFGYDFMERGRGEWGKKMQDDITDTVKSLVRVGVVDPDRVCIAGASYGGYAALAGGAFTPDLYKCIVSINGVSDLNEMLKDEKRAHGKHSEILTYWNKVIKNDGLDKKALDAVSPSSFADAFQAPVLLLHGTKDKVVEISQSNSMYKKLKKAGKKVSFVKLKNENHHLINAKTRMQTVKEMVSFVEQHLGAQ